MEPTADTPATTNPAELSSDDIMSAAMAADAGTPIPEPKPTPAAPANAPQDQKTETPTGTGEVAKPTGEKKPDANAPEKKTDTPEKQPGEKESDYTKAKKEAERKDRSWKKLEEEKAAFQAEKQRYDAELAGLRREVQQLKTRPTGPAKDEHGNTADVYDRLAKKYEDEGSTALAELAKEKAEALRKQSAATEPAAAASTGEITPEFRAEWQRHTQELIQQDPTLADPQNPVVVTANNLTADPTWKHFFVSRPDGIKAAVEVAKLIQISAKLPAAEKKIEELTAASAKDKAEIERLNKLLQPRGSHPSGPVPAAPSLDAMKGDEADAEIRRLAAAADRGEIT